jgi:plasmid stabilization system protein ParE
MKYEIRIHQLARQDLTEAFTWAYRQAPHTAVRWLARFRESIRALAADPFLLPLALENRKVSVEIRELHVGRRPNVFRVIYHIDGNIIRVLRIRRAQRRPLTKSQITESLQQKDLPEN